MAPSDGKKASVVVSDFASSILFPDVERNTPLSQTRQIPLGTCLAEFTPGVYRFTPGEPAALAVRVRESQSVQVALAQTP